METILEQQRRYHEERERLMDVMVKEMLTRKSTVRDGGLARPPSAPPSQVVLPKRRRLDRTSREGRDRAPRAGWGAPAKIERWEIQSRQNKILRVYQRVLQPVEPLATGMW